MADHVRKTIRTNVLAAMVTLTTTGGRFVDQLAFPFDKLDLPGGRLANDHDTQSLSEMGFGSGHRTFEHSYRMQIIAIARDTDAASAQDQVDDIAKEIEIKIAAGGLGCKYATLVATLFSYDTDGSRPVAQAALVYDFTYVTAENAPETAL